MNISPKNVTYLIQVNINTAGFNMINDADLFPRTLVFLIKKKIILPPSNSKCQSSIGSLH